MDKEKIIYQPKKYFTKNRTLDWGKDLTKEQMKSLKNGEIFLLLDSEKKPHKLIVMDSYNQIREAEPNRIGFLMIDTVWKDGKWIKK